MSRHTLNIAPLFNPIANTFQSRAAPSSSPASRPGPDQMAEGIPTRTQRRTRKRGQDCDSDPRPVRGRFRATSELPALPAQSAGATCRPERLLQSPMRGPRLPRVASWPRLLRVASCPAILPLGRRRSSGSGGFSRGPLFRKGILFASGESLDGGGPREAAGVSRGPRAASAVIHPRGPLHRRAGPPTRPGRTL